MIDLDTVLSVVADVFRVTLADIRGHRRFQRHMRAKHAVCWLMIRHGYGVTEAGELLGRHYTTVAASVQAADDLMLSDATYAAQLRVCQAALEGLRAPSLDTPAREPRTVASRKAKRRDAVFVEESIHIAMYWWGGIPHPKAA